MSSDISIKQNEITTGTDSISRGIRDTNEYEEGNILGTILFTTLDYDLNTNCTSGVCTIVAPGTYHVGSGLLTTASTVAVSTTISIGILKNGAIYSQRDVWPYTAAASKPASVTIDDEVVLATGDTVCIQASSNGTTPSITNTATKNYFYIKRIGD